MMDQSLSHSAYADTAEQGLAAGNMVGPKDSDEATAVTMQNTLLTPRFYTTNFDELDAIDVSPIRKEWDELINEMKADPNKGHFRKNEDWDHIDWDQMEPKLRAEFKDFLISSCTAEFSGCVLYKEMKRRGRNEDITTLFQLMARDEARHAGFINDALREAGISINLGFLTQAKKYTYFRPKFIWYAVYLSEKIGYARYITIYRHLEKHPENKFHPIFDWFEEWCNDEFRHGEAFAMLMHADPDLLKGRNKLWIRFFLLSVYATMYVRDHARPVFHKALGVDPTQYDYEVFDICNKIARQVYPVELDIDNPDFRARMEALRQASIRIEDGKAQGGLGGLMKRVSGMAGAGYNFARMYFMQPKTHELPATIRLHPAW